MAKSRRRKKLKHPYLGTYHVAYADDGTLRGMKLDYCSDGGDTADCSFAVLKGSCMMSDGCYGIPTFQAGGNVIDKVWLNTVTISNPGQASFYLNAGSQGSLDAVGVVSTGGNSAVVNESNGKFNVIKGAGSTGW